MHYKNLTLIVSFVLLAGCATFGVGGKTGVKATNSFRELRNRACAMGPEMRIIIQNEINASGVKGINLQEMCAHENTK